MQDAPGQVSPRTTWPWFLFAVALLVRVIVMLVTHRNRTSWTTLEFPDEQQYWLIASNLVEGLGLLDEIGHRAGRMPLYPAFLALFALLKNGVIVAKCAHLLLGAALVVAVYRLTIAIFDVRTAVIAGLLVASDPFLAFFSTLLLTETPFCLCLTLLFATIVPWIRNPERRISLNEWIAPTALAIILIYLRESTVGLLSLLVVFVLAARRFDWRCVRGAVLCLLITITALMPWAIRNNAVIGSWKWLTTRSGISLYDGIGPQANGSSNLGDIKQMPAVINLSEAEYDHYFRTESLKNVRENPRQIIALAMVKFRNTWNPFPNAASFQSWETRFLAAAWTFPTFTLALLGVILMVRRRGVYARIALFLLLPALYLTAVHMIFVGSIRYRLGAIPMIAIFAAYALVSLANAIRGQKSSE